MFFVSRNNKLYRSVGHLSSKRRYAITCAASVFLVVVWLRIIHYQLYTSSARYAQEYAELLKKYDDEVGSCRAVKELRNIYDATQRENDQYKQVNSDAYFKAELLSVFDIAHKSGLQFNTYSFVSMHEKDWYKKERYHLEMCGTFVDCMKFFELIKGSQKMITCNNITLSAAEDNLFQMSCTLGIVAVV